MNMNDKIIFISHAAKDSSIVSKFVDLLYDMGLNEDYIFCSSLSEIGVPLKVDIYDYLRNLLDSKCLITIYMLSDNYYASAACLNEMGASWIKQYDYYTFLLPGFSYKQIRGAINPNKRGIALGCKNKIEMQNLREDMNHFKDEMIKTFQLKQLERWNRKLDNFIDEINQHSLEKIKIDLRECEGFCIGDDNNDGCIVNYDEFTNCVTASIDFLKTNAEICSVVIFTEEINLSHKYQENTCISFDLKSIGTLKSIELECRLRNRDVRKELNIMQDWTSYRVPLKTLRGGTSEWEQLKEIKFLIRRKETLNCQLFIRNLKL